jgi:hypothetical protein
VADAVDRAASADASNERINAPVCVFENFFGSRAAVNLRVRRVIELRKGITVRRFFSDVCRFF